MSLVPRILVSTPFKLCSCLVEYPISPNAEEYLWTFISPSHKASDLEELVCDHAELLF